MTLRGVADMFAMFFCAGYATIPAFWLIMHGLMGRWRKRGRRAYWTVLPVWTALIVGVFAALLPWRSHHFYTGWLAWIPGALLLLAGLLVLRAAKRNFSSQQISGLAELEPERHAQVLVVSGIRRRIRHPIYLAHVLEMLGWCVGSGLAALYALFVVTLIFGAIIIRMEDRELEARFGEAYREYRRRVPAIVPARVGRG